MKFISRKNVILNGKYKGYKLTADDNTNSIQLVNKVETIDLKGRINSVCIKGNDKKDLYYFTIKEENETIKCLANFETYLRLIVYGMKVPTICLGI